MMTKRKHFFLLLIFVFALTGCGAYGASVDPVVKIGLVAPFAGDQSFIGYDVIYSARLAVREINEQGGINGYRVALVAYDDSSLILEATSVAEALIIEPNVVAVLGHWNENTTTAAGSLYDQAGLAYLPMGAENFSTADPGVLPPEWADAYQAITFQGVQRPGAFAGKTYDGMQLVFAAIEHATDSGSVVDRNSVASALPQVSIDGLTGPLQR